MSVLVLYDFSAIVFNIVISVFYSLNAGKCQYYAVLVLYDFSTLAFYYYNISYCKIFVGVYEVRFQYFTLLIL